MVVFDIDIQTMVFGGTGRLNDGEAVELEEALFDDLAFDPSHHEAARKKASYCPCTSCAALNKNPT